MVSLRRMGSVKYRLQGNLCRQLCVNACAQLIACSRALYIAGNPANNNLMLCGAGNVSALFLLTRHGSMRYEFIFTALEAGCGGPELLAVVQVGAWAVTGRKVRFLAKGLGGSHLCQGGRLEAAHMSLPGQQHTCFVHTGRRTRPCLLVPTHTPPWQGSVQAYGLHTCRA